MTRPFGAARETNESRVALLVEAPVAPEQAAIAIAPAMVAPTHSARGLGVMGKPYNGH
jgi:hypothetical protein